MERHEILKIYPFWLAINVLSKRANDVYKIPVELSAEEMKLLQRAQRIIEETFQSSEPNPFLTSLFSKISLHEGSAITPSFYPHAEINEKIVFPIKDTNQFENRYRDLWEALKHTLNSVTPTPYNMFLIVQRFCSYIPYKEVQGCDISLFDYARLLSAVLNCLAMSEDNREPFFLVGGDFSGIQQFIYTITSKGALKTLRARSFFLELLTEHTVYEILNTLNLTPSNIVMAGGGRFTLLVPSAPEVADYLDEFSRRINQTLLNHHHGRIYLIIDRVVLEEDDIKRISKKWSELGRRISEHKRQRFRELIFSGKDAVLEFFTPRTTSEDINKDEIKILEYPIQGNCPYCNTSGDKKAVLQFDGEELYGCPACIGIEGSLSLKRRECQICHKYTYLVSLPEPHSDVQVCINCANLYHIGEHLHYADSIVRYKSTDKYLNSKGLIKIQDAVYQLVLAKNNIHSDQAEALWFINSWKTSDINTERWVNLLFLGNYPSHHDMKLLKDSGLLEGSENIREFRTLAEKSTGAIRLGVLRMDVDSLGDITMRGFSEQETSLLRLSTLSMRLNLFFKNYLNAILRGELKESTGLLPSSGQMPRAAVTVYAGGDDLFIVGAWNDIAEVAIDIREGFKRYAAYNPDITLSGGFAVVSSDYPLYRMAKLAERAEEKAKELKKDGKKKDALTLFYSPENAQAYRWDGTVSVKEITRLVELFISCFYHGQNNGMVELACPGSFINELLFVAKNRVSTGKLYLPRLAYSISRKDIKPVDESASESFESLKTLLLDLNSNVIDYLHPAITWVKLLNRR